MKRFFKLILVLEVILIGLGGCAEHKSACPATTKPAFEWHSKNFPGPDAPTIYKV